MQRKRKEKRGGRASAVARPRQAWSPQRRTETCACGLRLPTGQTTGGPVWDCGVWGRRRGIRRVGVEVQQAGGRRGKDHILFPGNSEQRAPASPTPVRPVETDTMHKLWWHNGGETPNRGPSRGGLGRRQRLMIRRCCAPTSFCWVGQRPTLKSRPVPRPGIAPLCAKLKCARPQRTRWGQLSPEISFGFLGREKKQPPKQLRLAAGGAEASTACAPLDPAKVHPASCRLAVRLHHARALRVVPGKLGIHSFPLAIWFFSLRS